MEKYRYVNCVSQYLSDLLHNNKLHIILFSPIRFEYRRLAGIFTVKNILQKKYPSKIFLVKAPIYY